MNKHFFIGICYLILTSCYKSTKLKSLGKIPKKLNEISGITYMKSSNTIWAHNDSGNKSVIYELDLTGKILSKIKLDTKQTDWEDITKDSSGNLYIGDLGNNTATRNNFCILKLYPNKKSIIKNINFSYPDKAKDIDAESLLHFKDNLYIFTKARKKKHFGKTTLYKIPAREGTFTAEKLETFKYCPEKNCSITAAAISPNSKTVALLTKKSILLFSDFENDNFFNGTFKEIPLDFISQKESLTFKDDKTLLFSEEKSHGKKPKLYQLSID